MFEVRHELPDDAAAIAEVSVSATASLRQTYRPNSKALANKAQLSRELRSFQWISSDRIPNRSIKKRRCQRTPLRLQSNLSGRLCIT
jgi:hypothetical protein